MISLLLLFSSLPLLNLSETCGYNRIPFGFEVHKNGHLTLLCSRPNCFDKRYAECSERAEEKECTGNDTWVGGLERTVDGQLFLQCCKFEPLANYGEKLFNDVKVRRGEYFEGEEKTEENDDYVVYFDLITNIKRIGSPSTRDMRNEHYELAVSRFHCGKEPEVNAVWKKKNYWPFFKTKDEKNLCILSFYISTNRLSHGFTFDSNCILSKAITATDAQSFQQTNRALIRQLFKNYDSFSSPYNTLDSNSTWNNGSYVNVKGGFMRGRLIELVRMSQYSPYVSIQNERQRQFTINAGIILQYNDPRLTWNPSNFRLIRHIYLKQN
ncbi:wrt-5 [Pristionchus pacificus]|uniref:Wrt-3 n=1 Tax=Pristionchus pacificus TaxID=54126 RepID=A0A2A6CAG2_PRIPA|nr:wrt-5 [Pristionchus pacificus]|eukprot:PDM75202.1 wrt-3 [Pristionchus pacificus]